MDHLDKIELENFFCQCGYVLNFTNETFDTFTKQSIDIALQSKYGASKGKSLKAFTEEEKDEALIVKLYSDLLDYYNRFFISKGLSSEDEIDAYDKCREIIKKYQTQDYLNIKGLKEINNNYIKEIAERANEDIVHGETDSALTKVRTLLEEIFIFGLEKKNITFKRNGNITEYFKLFREAYKMDLHQDLDKRIKSLVSGLCIIVDSIAEMRNNNSDAHGVGSGRKNIKEHHARLFVNAGALLANFLIEVINLQTNDI